MASPAAADVVVVGAVTGGANDSDSGSPGRRADVEGGMTAAGAGTMLQERRVPPPPGLFVQGASGKQQRFFGDWIGLMATLYITRSCKVVLQ